MIETMFEEELAEFLGRMRPDRSEGAAKGHRHGHRERQLTGTFGSETLQVPRARIEAEDGKVTKWRSKALPRTRRLTRKAEALIAAVSLAGTNTRRVQRALISLFEGAVSKDVIALVALWGEDLAIRRCSVPGIAACWPMPLGTSTTS